MCYKHGTDIDDSALDRDQTILVTHVDNGAAPFRMELKTCCPLLTMSITSKLSAIFVNASEPYGVLCNRDCYSRVSVEIHYYLTVRHDTPTTIVMDTE